jgi:PilZ domain-containing protein
MHTYFDGGAKLVPVMTDRQRPERPGYPRLRAPVYFNPVVLGLFRRRRQPADLGGVRVYTDEVQEEGSTLEIEVFLPDGATIVCGVEVAWVESLPIGAPARCDVGLRFTAIHPHDRERLSSVMEHA